jgi:hypothetical protein
MSGNRQFFLLTTYFQHALEALHPNIAVMVSF